MSYKISAISAVFCLATVQSMPVHATTPWVMEEGASSIYISHVAESFDEKYLGSEGATPIPEIEQSTSWINYYYGLTSKTTLGVQLGYTSSEWEGSDYRYHGLADTKLSATYELKNQFMDETPWTISLWSALTIAGTYERGAGGRPHAPGDEANGFEGALLAGRQLSERLSTNTSFGYRFRADDVPDEIFYSAALHYTIVPQFTTSILLDAINAIDGDDINDPSFAGEFFKTEEDRAILDLIFSYRVGGVTLVGGYGRVIDVSGIAETRNTGKSDILHFSFGYDL